VKLCFTVQQTYPIAAAPPVRVSEDQSLTFAAQFLAAVTRFLVFRS
jgi:hypothetical protein